VLVTDVQDQRKIPLASAVAKLKLDAGARTGAGPSLKTRRLDSGAQSAFVRLTQKNLKLKNLCHLMVEDTVLLAITVAGIKRELPVKKPVTLSAWLKASAHLPLSIKDRLALDIMKRHVL